jgi:hypothetical protein
MAVWLRILYGLFATLSLGIGGYLLLVDWGRGRTIDVTTHYPDGRSETVAHPLRWWGVALIKLVELVVVACGWMALDLATGSRLPVAGTRGAGILLVCGFAAGMFALAGWVVRDRHALSRAARGDAPAGPAPAGPSTMDRQAATTDGQATGAPQPAATPQPVGPCSPAGAPAPAAADGLAPGRETAGRETAGRETADGVDTFVENALRDGPGEAVRGWVVRAVALAVLRLPFGWALVAALPATAGVLLLSIVPPLWRGERQPSSPLWGHLTRGVDAIDTVALYGFWGLVWFVALVDTASQRKVALATLVALTGPAALAGYTWLTARWG